MTASSNPGSAGRMAETEPVVPIERIASLIYLIRGEKVMLDSDLAVLYQVTTGNLNLAVRRNQRRFPEDFVFQLTVEEFEGLLLQNARAKGRGGRRTPPYAFTEQGDRGALQARQGAARATAAAKETVDWLRTAGGRVRCKDKEAGPTPRKWFPGDRAGAVPTVTGDDRIPEGERLRLRLAPNPPRSCQLATPSCCRMASAPRSSSVGLR